MISIHAPREGSDGGWDPFHGGQSISIHAPREGSDGHSFRHVNGMLISIHAPREGSDVPSRGDGAHVYLFQSTLPVRGATTLDRKREMARIISIHAPREGSDPCACPCASDHTPNFNPRSP